MLKLRSFYVREIFRFESHREKKKRNSIISSTDLNYGSRTDLVNTKKKKKKTINCHCWPQRETQFSSSSLGRKNKSGKKKKNPTSNYSLFSFFFPSTGLIEKGGGETNKRRLPHQVIHPNDENNKKKKRRNLIQLPPSIASFVVEREQKKMVSSPFSDPNFRLIRFLSILRVMSFNASDECQKELSY